MEKSTSVLYTALVLLLWLKALGYLDLGSCALWYRAGEWSCIAATGCCPYPR